MPSKHIETVKVQHKKSKQTIVVNKHEFEAGEWSDYMLAGGGPKEAEAPKEAAPKE